MNLPKPHKFHASLRLQTGAKVFFWTAVAASATIAIEHCHTRPLPLIVAAILRVV